MEKDEINQLYKQLCHDFTVIPFNEVIEKCDEIIRKYYSCFPLLLQMGLLIINHSMLDKTQTLELNKKAKDLFQRVKCHSDDVDLAKQAQILEAQCCLLLNDPKEALILLEGSEKPQLSGELLQVNAHLMLGETENAKSDLQISMFQSLMKIVGSFSLLLPIAEPNQFEETVSTIYEVR